MESYLKLSELCACSYEGCSQVWAEDQHEYAYMWVLVGYDSK